MLRQEIARIDEMIDAKLAEFKEKLIAEFGPPPEKPQLAAAPKPAAPAKKEPEKKVEEKEKEKK
jgi:hypothetical protein